MNREIKNLLLLALFAVAIASVSLYADLGNESYKWFQRSGSLVVLIGAILSYRSIFRLGVRGVGGAPSATGRIGKLKNSYIDDNGLQRVQVEMNPDDVEYDRQIEIDKLSGFIGATFIVFGTITWGYGDLLGKI